MLNKAIKWTDIICRYFICFLMLVYGGTKIFQAQFYTDNYWKDTPLGQLSGMQLAWSFHSYSPIYEPILGLVEVAIGLLVLFPRTTKLGVFLFVPVMLNLVLLNVIFEIGALPTALPLLAAGLVLFALHFKSYRAFFFGETSGKTSLRIVAARSVVILLGCAVAGLLVYRNKFTLRQDERLKGAWELVSQEGTRQVYFEKRNTCVVRDGNDSLHFANYETAANKLSIANDENLLNWNDLPYSILGDTLSVFRNEGRVVLVRKH